MTVKEFIEELSYFDSDLEVAIWDGYAMTAQQIGSIYVKDKDEMYDRDMVWIEGGQLV
jgi:hypothetical protein